MDRNPDLFDQNSSVGPGASNQKTGKNMVVHQVYFWLKNPNSAEDLDKLLAGLKSLEQIETVNQLFIGVPAVTGIRDVVDGSYSASELIFFDDLESHDIYQVHPIHQQFINDCGSLWSKVVVYDSLSSPA
ncbi:Dabb family protein [Segetibacter sp. 3557_3]|uniref:Dabb family protein n=1 Tax=Segetibacter sp. 3557_3 TaxID=2547429 RepID=UPI001058A83B|nr:Dabb family protein [Segetibacter sp. 3557_3]TDH27399.1 Dabb family protein [Segetibacter sp. 3557_3]